MSDKEKVEKENEQFSSSILYLATAMYVGVCAMVFGALYAKMPSLVEAFLLLMKDYGTVLAGIPVLVAVVVAKQQLDANRRQHVATVKRSFKDEIDALNTVHNFAQNVRNTDYRLARLRGTSFGHSGINFPTMSKEEFFKIKQYLPFGIAQNTEQTLIEIATAVTTSMNKSHPDDDVSHAIAYVHQWAGFLIRDTSEEHDRISQYWS